MVTTDSSYVLLSYLMIHSFTIVFIGRLKSISHGKVYFIISLMKSSTLLSVILSSVSPLTKSVRAAKKKKTLTLKPVFNLFETVNFEMAF